MKLYLDENLSPKYRHAFDSERMQLFTYQFMGWQGKKNGELLRLLSIHGFRGVITSDQSMYSNNQLSQHRLHFFLIHSASDTSSARMPLMDSLNDYLLKSYEKFDSATSSRVVVTDGVVDKNMSEGIHVLYFGE